MASGSDLRLNLSPALGPLHVVYSAGNTSVSFHLGGLLSMLQNTVPSPGVLPGPPWKGPMLAYPVSCALGGLTSLFRAPG